MKYPELEPQIIEVTPDKKSNDQRIQELLERMNTLIDRIKKRTGKDRQ